MKFFIIFNILILLVITLRALAQGRISRRLQYGMWLVLPVFLIISVFAFQVITISVPGRILKVFRHSYTGQPLDMEAESYFYGHLISEKDTLVAEPAVTDDTRYTGSVSSEHIHNTVIHEASVEPVNAAKETTDFYLGLKAFYLSGLFLVSLFILVSNIIFLQKLRMSRSFYGRSPYGNLMVYRTNETYSPFLFCNSIYIGRNINEGSDAYDMALCHEYCHYRQGDGIWLIVEYIILCLFWFDPLVWTAHFLVKQDREMAVDERVISMLGSSRRRSYSETLLYFFSKTTEDEPVLSVATTMSGKNGSFLKKRVKGIMHGTRKSIAITLIIVMLLSASAGCTLFKPANNGDGEKITDDTPWYTVQSAEYGGEYDEQYDFANGTLMQRIIGKISAGYVFTISGGYGDQMENKLYEIALYSESGEKRGSIDLISAFREQYPEEDEMSMIIYSWSDFYIEDDTVKMVKGRDLDHEIRIYDIDIETGIITIEKTYTYFSWDWRTTGTMTVCGDYQLFTSRTGSQRFLTLTADGEALLYTVDGSETLDFPSFVSNPVAVSDHEVVMTDNQAYLGDLWLFDLELQTFSKADNDEYSWIYPYITGNNTGYSFPCYGTDGYNIFVTETEICRVDTVNRKVDTLALLENIDINRNLLSGDIVPFFFAADSGYIEFGSFTMDKSGFTIYKATLCDHNPNSGKTIITTDGHSDYVYDAVYLFNHTDEDYFVKIVEDKYLLDGSSYYEGNELNVYSGQYSSMVKENHMRIDLMSGDCPDVVFYTSWYSQLNNGNCMTDLSELYDNSDLRDHVFTNIVDAFRVDGKLYSMPLCFNLQGIVVDRSRYSFEGNGMDLDEFYDFTHDYCNGSNILSNTRTEFLENELFYNYDLFERDGYIDLDDPYFRELAEYTNTNVFDLDYFEDMNIFNYMTLVSCHFDWINYLSTQGISYGNADLVGWPSPDKRGPEAQVFASVSITNSCRSPEGAWRFICMLCNTDIQRYQCSALTSWDAQIPLAHGFPINTDAYDLVAEDAVQAYNTYMSRQFGYVLDIHSTTDVDLDDIRIIRDIISSIDHVTTSDYDINIIVYEEMQAYFVGDKTLDEVIEIMNDRARTVINERK